VVYSVFTFLNQIQDPAAVIPLTHLIVLQSPTRLVSHTRIERAQVLWAVRLSGYLLIRILKTGPASFPNVEGSTARPKQENNKRIKL
jgi:hypothetical protein